jgi:hypothetical protein
MALKKNRKEQNHHCVCVCMIFRVFVLCDDLLLLLVGW